MLEKHDTKFVQIALALFAGLHFTAISAMAKDAVQAAEDLAAINQTDPNGYTLMIVSICMLFVFALTLIIATSVHVFKRPSQRPAARNQQRERVGTH